MITKNVHAAGVPTGRTAPDARPNARWRAPAAPPPRAGRPGGCSAGMPRARAAVAPARARCKRPDARPVLCSWFVICVCGRKGTGSITMTTWCVDTHTILSYSLFPPPRPKKDLSPPSAASTPHAAAASARGPCAATWREPSACARRRTAPVGSKPAAPERPGPGPPAPGGRRASWPAAGTGGPVGLWEGRVGGWVRVDKGTRRSIGGFTIGAFGQTMQSI